MPPLSGIVNHTLHLSCEGPVGLIFAFCTGIFFRDILFRGLFLPLGGAQLEVDEEAQQRAQQNDRA